jgi:hypothetical protein
MSIQKGVTSSRPSNAKLNHVALKSNLGKLANLVLARLRANYNQGLLYIWSKSRDHEIVRAQKKTFKDHPNDTSKIM